MAANAEEPPSSFDKLRMRATVAAAEFEFLILSLSKGEEFARGRSKCPEVL
jgi:hypothetical protein